jgi:hypothetical protein
LNVSAPGNKRYGHNTQNGQKPVTQHNTHQQKLHLQLRRLATPDKTRPPDMLDAEDGLFVEFFVFITNGLAGNHSTSGSIVSKSQKSGAFVRSPQILLSSRRSNR